MPKKSVFRRKSFKNASISSVVAGIGGAESPHVRTMRGFENQGKEHPLVVATKSDALKGHSHVAHIDHPTHGHVHLHIPTRVSHHTRKKSHGTPRKTTVPKRVPKRR